MGGWTPYNLKELWCICHHHRGQMAMAHQPPYPSPNMVHLSPSFGANDYGGLDTIHGANDYGAFDTIL